MRMYIGSLPKGTTWLRVATIVDLLSEDSVRWPPRAQFAGWLQSEVVAALRFILEGTPMPELRPKMSVRDHASAIGAEEAAPADGTPFVTGRHGTPANDDAAEVDEQRAAHVAPESAVSDAAGDPQFSHDEPDADQEEAATGYYARPAVKI